MSKIKTKFIEVIETIDPDSYLPVNLAIYKLETGGIVGIDVSFLQNTDETVYSPFDNGLELEIL